MGDANRIRTLRDYSKPSHDIIRLVQNGCSFHGLRSEDPNQHLKDFLKLVDSLDLDGENRERMTYYKKSLIMASTFGFKSKSFMTMSIPSQDKPLTNRPVVSFVTETLIELENQVQRLMEAHLAPTQPTQVNKITTSCEICSGPHDTQYCMEDPEQAFVEYASSRTDEAGVLSAHSYPTEEPQSLTHIHGSINAITIHPNQQSDSHDDEPTESKEEENDSSKNTNTNPSASPDPSVSFVTEKLRRMTIPARRNPKQEDWRWDILTLLTWSELAYHKYLMCGPIPSIFLRDPIITKGCPSNLKIPCNIRHVHVKKSYIDLNSPLNVMTRMMYNWIMRRKLDPRENSDRGVSNFTGRIKGMHAFIGNFTYVTDFMIIEDISSIMIMSWTS
ncbi:hypothetical protein Tco_1229218 [Tanacetum coccineum]